MNGFTWAWIGWAIAFVAIEGLALAVKDRPGRRATLSAHVWWLVRGAGPVHQALRVLLVFGLGWLTNHLFS